MVVEVDPSAGADILEEKRHEIQRPTNKMSSSAASRKHDRILVTTIKATQ